MQQLDIVAVYISCREKYVQYLEENWLVLLIEHRAGGIEKKASNEVPIFIYKTFDP